MAERIEARALRGERKESLFDAVPLPSPWTMFIEPTNACNFRCKYCPTGDTALLKSVGRKNALMDYDLFCKVVDDMAHFPRKVKMVNLYKDGESLIHPRFCEMVRYLRWKDVADKIWLKTNGHLLAPDLNEQLVNCGLDMIGVSVQHVHAQGFYDIAGVKIDYDRYRANVLDLYQRSRNAPTRISAKIADVGLTEADKEQFYADFGDRTDYITIEGLHGWSASERADFRLGTENSFDGNPRTHKVACPLVMYMLTVNANGDISICNDDWMHAHQIGNAAHMGLMDIWHSDKLKQFRLMHLEGRRSENAACANCDYLQALPDSIDEHREAFAERIANE